jgi:S1-C subfamily serine protease
MVLKNFRGNTEVVNLDSEKILKALGARFEEVSQAEQNKLNISGGAKVAQLFSGKLMSAGVQVGFIITHIDKQHVKGVEDVLSILEEKKGGVLIEGVYPNGKERYYGFGM